MAQLVSNNVDPTFQAAKYRQQICICYRIFHVNGYDPLPPMAHQSLWYASLREMTLQQHAKDIISMLELLAL